MVLFRGWTKNRHHQGDRKENSGCQGLGREKGKLVFNGIQFQFGEMEKSSRRMVAVTLNSVNMPTPLNCALTDAENAMFYDMYFLPQF